jgi:CheY-like chemotaxis protein
MRDFQILVVDDDQPAREMLTEVLDGQGYGVTTASNGREALEQMEQRLPSLVLLDAIMPVANGRDVADAMQRRGMRVPIILLTASPFAPLWARDVGATEFLPKPFDIDELLAIVERVRAASGDDGSGTTLPA